MLMMFPFLQKRYFQLCGTGKTLTKNTGTGKQKIFAFPSTRVLKLFIQMSKTFSDGSVSVTTEQHSDWGCPT